MLARISRDWRNAVISVAIDRGIGMGLLIALAFLNTVRTEYFDQVLGLRPLLPGIAKAA